MKFCDVNDPASLKNQQVHPLGSRATILLTSVFGPFAQDDEYGSRKLNPMELYHNQVTRVQGPFSIRMFYRSCGLMMIQANIAAPCTVLDYPDLNRFVQEVSHQEVSHKEYDIIGISAISSNLKKVEKMCAIIRNYQPNAKIVVGGHLSNMNLHGRVDADYVVRGEGIRWFRSYLGEDVHQPIKHPQIPSVTKIRCMGINLKIKPRDTAAVLIPSVGCPLGCDFCATSAMFGGKGRYVNFYETGDELFDIMCQLEKEMRVRSFFVMDDNFLLQKPRALRLLQLMQEHDKAWTLYTFGSADILKSYTMEQLIGLGISWLWTGLEGKSSQYEKLKGVDTKSLVHHLRENGIRVMGSSIIGLEEHTPQNIDEVIEWAVSHEADFHQFMLYTPPPGTPLYDKISQKNALRSESEIEWADIHGQWQFNYHHPHIKDGQESEFLLRAFQRDFDRNGPSIVRMIATLMNGWQKYKNHPEGRIRRRLASEIEKMPVLYAGALWATRHWFRENPRIAGRIAELLDGVYREFGLKSRLAAPIIGRIALHFLQREARRLQNGYVCEPPMFYENLSRSVTPKKKPV
jgi:radical SAM superfamily enzyme YgiQ (UPF0313 family)